MIETVYTGFGNAPAWVPGILSREEERGHWIHKVGCLDQQVHCLEQAAFFGKLARQCDALLQPWDVEIRGAETRGAGELRQPEKTEAGLAKSEDHEHQRSQLLSQAHVTIGADTEPEMVPDAEFQTTKAKTGSKYWKPEHVDPEDSLERDELVADSTPPRPDVESKGLATLVAPSAAKTIKNKAKSKMVASSHRAPAQSWQETVDEYVKWHEKMRPDPYAGEPLAEGEDPPPPVKITKIVWEANGPSQDCRACAQGGPEFDKNHHTPECRKRFAYICAGKALPRPQVAPALVATSEPAASTDLLCIVSKNSSADSAVVFTASASFISPEAQPALIAASAPTTSIASSSSNGKGNTGEDEKEPTPEEQERQEKHDAELWREWCETPPAERLSELLSEHGIPKSMSLQEVAKEYPEVAKQMRFYMSWSQSFADYLLSQRDPFGFSWMSYKPSTAVSS